VTLIISAFAFIIAFFFMPETYLPLLLDWKAEHLRRVTGDDRFVSEHAQSSSFLKRLREELSLPAKFLLTEPVITVLGAVSNYWLHFLPILDFFFFSKKAPVYKLESSLGASEYSETFTDLDQNDNY
jgi:hypothetical protein